MAAIKLGQLYGGKQFKAEFFSGGQTHSLSSSTPLVINPLAGKTLRLDFVSGSSSISDVSVLIGGATFVNGSLSNIYSSSGFVVSGGMIGANTTASQSNVVQPIVAFEPDQSITISTTTAGSTNIFYSYSYGE